jgi:hypothetical protein
MGLRATQGGFGTPEFDSRVARVEGDRLVEEREESSASQTISTVRAAAAFFGMEYRVDWFTEFHDPLPPTDPDRDLDIDVESALSLAAWFHLGFDVLEEMRRRSSPGDDASEVQLWPEHFDPATEIGAEGRRASYGASPGDAAHEEPYFYVAAWGEIDRDVEYWNDRAFNGASLGYGTLLGAASPHDVARDFLIEGYRILDSG